MLCASRWSVRLPVIAAFTAACSATPALAAVNAYLVIDGIDGASTSRAHAIDILSFSAGAARVTDANQAAKIRRLACQGLNVMKVVDRTTPRVRSGHKGRTRCASPASLQIVVLRELRSQT